VLCPAQFCGFDAIYRLVMTTSAMQQEDDPFEIAAAIMRDRPQWLVIYGVYSREYWAYALFRMRRRMIVHARYPDALIPRMDAAERKYRIWPQGKGGDQEC
jgi:hypothetical protein